MTDKAFSFCEEDYDITVYLAEFINSLTNLAYVYYALRYMYGRGSQGLLAPKSDFMSVSLLVLGIASFSFHATLRHSLQFADELAMLGLVWSMLQGLLTARRPSQGDSTRHRRHRTVTISLAVVFPIFGAFYVWSGKIIYHVIAFALAVALIIGRGVYLFYWRVPSFPEQKVRGWRVRGRIALIAMGVAYAIWNVDLEFCAELRELRGQVGLPWAWVLEPHGWWHLLTAFSAGRFMDIVREVQDEVRSQTEETKKE